MDPNACLDEMRTLAESLAESDDPDPCDVERLAYLVQSLDQWITKGGFLPAAWAPTETWESARRAMNEQTEHVLAEIKANRPSATKAAEIRQWCGFFKGPESAIGRRALDALDGWAALQCTGEPLSRFIDSESCR